WFEYLSQRDFTFGTRLHGCIASLVGGTPAMLFAHDSRTLEIAEHFALPYINLNYENRTLDAKELYDLVDLNPMQNKYEDNLRIYAQFLRKNGLETIVDQKDKMKEFDANVTHEMRNLWVEPLAMNNQCIGERLHWLKNNYDLKIKDQLKKRELNSIDHSKKLRAEINKAVQVHMSNFSKVNDVEFDFENNLIDSVKKAFGKKVKSWLYKENFVANHFDIKGNNFIVDILVKEEGGCFYFFDKEYLYSALVIKYFELNKLNYDIEKRKVKLTFEGHNLDKILSILKGYISFIHENLDENI